MTAAGTLNNVVALGITSWLPTYLQGEKGVRYEDLAWLAAVPYASSLLGLVAWSQIGDRFNWRGYCGGVGYLLAAACVWLALTADSLGATLFFFAAGTFGVSAFNACEFAMVQRIAPASRVAAATGVYNGFAAIVGGGLGPYIVSGIVSGGRGTAAILPIVSVSVLASACLTALGRITRY
jgi:MFS family permease